MIKNVIFIFLLFTASSCFSLDCNNIIESNEILPCSEQFLAKAKNDLNKAYNKILFKYRNYPAALKASIRAEEAWIKFRDAQLAMKFPPLKKGHFYGSIHTVFVLGYLEMLTNERVKQLEDVLNDDYVDQANA